MLAERGRSWEADGRYESCEAAVTTRQSMEGRMRDVVERARAQRLTRARAILEWGSVEGSSLSAALYFCQQNLRPIPLCWPRDGECGCGQGHRFAGRAPLIPKISGISSVSRTVVTAWFTKWPAASIGILVKPSRIIAARARTAKAQTEAESRFSSMTPFGWSPSLPPCRCGTSGCCLATAGPLAAGIIHRPGTGVARFEGGTPRVGERPSWAALTRVGTGAGGGHRAPLVCVSRVRTGPEHDTMSPR